MLKKLVLIGLVVAGVLNAESSFALENRAVRNIYKAQCKAVGGEVNGFCMCSEKVEILALAVEAVEVAVTTQKLDKSSLGIINPFTQSCPNSELDLKASYARLKQMVDVSSKYTKNAQLLEEIHALEEAGLLEPGAFSQYLSRGKFRDQIKAKVTTMKTKQDMLLKSMTGKGLIEIGKERTKMKALAYFQELTEIDIAQAKMLTTSVRQAVTDCVENSSKKSLGSTLYTMGKGAVKKGAKNLGKAFIAGVISAAAFETASYLIGYDITRFDPFEIAFGVTQMGDATISGHITRTPSALYQQEYKSSFELGLYKDYVDAFSGKVALMSMIAEARSNGDSYVHFLDY